MTLNGHRTSIALEPSFWDALDRLARRRNTSLAGLVAELDGTRGTSPLASVLRVYALETATSLRMDPKREA